MTNRDACISIINELEEESLYNVASMLRSVKKLIDDAADDAFCNLQSRSSTATDYPLDDYDYELARQADEDTSTETITLEEFCLELGITL
jgi:hypothetical protein